MAYFDSIYRHYRLYCGLKSLISKCRTDKFDPINGCGSDILDDASAYLRAVSYTLAIPNIDLFKELVDLFEEAVKRYSERFSSACGYFPGAHDDYQESLCIATELILRTPSKEEAKS